VACNCEEEKLEVITSDPGVYKHLTISLVLIMVMGALLYFSKLSSVIAPTTSEITLGVALIFGITAGFSTCMALVGGIVVAISARFAENHPDATRVQRWKPQIVFNLGRIIIFGLLGGLIGYLGSFISFTPAWIGIITLLVAIYMLYLGLQLTGISPKLTSYTITLPKKMANIVHSESTFLLGGMTFFLPCGFTQAVQLAAVASGSAWTGALIMTLFAIGTTPGLLVVGLLSSNIRGKWSQAIFTFVGVLVILLSLLNIRNSWNLMNLGGTTAPAKQNAVMTVDGTQVIKMNVTNTGYSPNNFVVKKDLPVRWEINVEDANTCASFLVAPKIIDYKALKRGTNTIEFTPTETGNLNFSCSMGMYTGRFVVE